ncbi:H-2 class II histocompatibility antigen, E-S beta chain-like [Chanos chanos]|uniref:H-2 class II histocompatibility antigen, E-S beta chain-like n=1 Tax=Chanos chanos TaxID=29144 RepID=A0A6J2UN35_CHACN|nr:H-2 class II histocompatibility antigen, E-S beta chain-like [Chanos chanos]
MEHCLLGKMFRQSLLGLHLLVLISVFSETDGYYGYRTTECHFRSRNLIHVDYIRTYNFNKFEYMRFNSTVGEFEGFNLFGQFYADILNNDTVYLQQLKDLENRYCRNNAIIFFSSLLEKSVQPEVHVRTVKTASGTNPAVLMCSAYDFYPKQITLTWLKDGEEVTSNVTTTELANGDWYYQIHSQLEYIPKSGENISCMVEHASFNETMIYDLEPEPKLESKPELLETVKFAVGVSGFGLGVILAVTGLIYYKTTRATGMVEVVT